MDGTTKDPRKTGLAFLGWREYEGRTSFCDAPLPGDLFGFYLPCDISGFIRLISSCRKTMFVAGEASCVFQGNGPSHFPLERALCDGTGLIFYSLYLGTFGGSGSGKYMIA